MNISDIITLVSLAIAIIAILSEKNRNHLLFKFHIVDYILFLLCFGLINYFVFYESFLTRGLYISQLYTNWGLKNPQNYAYLISIGILIYFFYKIWYAFYPYNKLQRVISFYGRLIENNEVSFLLDIIDRYHKIDIIKVVEKTKDYDANNDIWQFRFHKETSKEKVKRRLNEVIKFLFPNSWQNRKVYGVNVLHRVLNNPAFMILVSNQRPYLFAEIFSHFKKAKRDGFPKDLINLFLSELLLQKQFWLKKELQESQNHDIGQPEWFFENNRILAALIQDLSVADVNEVWRPFGEAAMHEIEDERNLGYESKMFQEFKGRQFLWEYRTYFSIQFFFILVIEAIIKKYPDSHFWLYYYRSLTNSILKTFQKYPPENFEQVQTVYHSFIDITVGNCFSWLRISNDSEDNGFYHDILSCLGDMILDICNNDYYSEKEKTDYIERMFSEYCGLKTNSQSEKLRSKIGDTIIKPSALIKNHDPYYTYVSEAWRKFDKIPHKGGMGISSDEDYPYFKQFKSEVIIPLGLDPNMY